MPPPVARKVWLDHRFDECTTILILNEPLVKEASCQSKGNLIQGRMSLCRRTLRDSIALEGDRLDEAPQNPSNPVISESYHRLG
jgi:hypothetical protein